MEHSKPINIKKTINNSQREYWLNESSDNPFKHSPPNSWKSRLGERYINLFNYNGSGTEFNNSKIISTEKTKV